MPKKKKKCSLEKKSFWHHSIFFIVKKKYFKKFQILKHCMMSLYLQNNIIPILMKNRKCFKQNCCKQVDGGGVEVANRKFLMKNCDHIFSRRSLRREQDRVGRGKELSYISHQ